MGVGRPTKLTPEMIDAICALISEGLPVLTVCQSVGISDPTFYDWMQRGYSENATDLQREFSSRVTRARGEGKMKLVREILGDDDGGWKARAWILERTAPKEFGKHERREVNVTAQPSTSWKDIAGGLGLSNGEDTDES